MMSRINQNNLMPERSRLFCPLESTNVEMFFSLVDYRNNYFASDDPKRIIEFYNGFENRDQLIQWMRERPKGVANIHEVNGDKDIIVVIPTADFNGKYAKECRGNIFKGIHIIFVESGGRGDFYFNLAHNINVGIRKAMEYNLKWVVLSNDDVNSSFNSDNLKSELSKINNKTTNMVLTKKGSQSSNKTSICSFTPLGLLIYKFLNITKLYALFKKLKNFHLETQISMNLGNRYFILRYGRNIFNIIRRRVYSFYNFEAFGIFSYIWLRDHPELFDETYINAQEDQDLSIALSKEPEKISWINYGIDGLGGGTMGINLQRAFRSVASDSYLNYKIERELLDKIPSSP